MGRLPAHEFQRPGHDLSYVLMALAGFVVVGVVQKDVTARNFLVAGVVVLFSGILFAFSR